MRRAASQSRNETAVCRAPPLHAKLCAPRHYDALTMTALTRRSFLAAAAASAAAPAFGAGPIRGEVDIVVVGPRAAAIAAARRIPAANLRVALPEPTGRPGGRRPHRTPPFAVP